MVDTNILIMGSVLRSEYIQNLFRYIIKHHKMVLSDYIIDELKTTTKKKFPDKYYLAEGFLQDYSYEIVAAPENFNKNEFPDIRDIKDLPILVTAINENLDIILTNDIDFKALNIEHPEILSPKEFLDKYADFT